MINTIFSQSKIIFFMNIYPEKIETRAYHKNSEDKSNLR